MGLETMSLKITPPTPQDNTPQVILTFLRVKQTQSRNNKENLFKIVDHCLEKIFLIVSTLCLFVRQCGLRSYFFLRVKSDLNKSQK